MCRTLYELGAGCFLPYTLSIRSARTSCKLVFPPSVTFQNCYQQSAIDLKLNHGTETFEKDASITTEFRETQVNISGGRR